MFNMWQFYLRIIIENSLIIGKKRNWFNFIHNIEYY